VGSDTKLSIINQSSPEGEGQLKLFGYSIPYLPDFLMDHTLLGEKPLERIDEYLENWVQFVGWLWKWRDSAFSIRYHSKPLDGEIQAFVLGRLLVTNSQQLHLAEVVAADLQRLLNTIGLPTIPLAERELHEVLRPFESPALVEVRQHEELISLSWQKDKEGYIVHPYSFPSGSMLAPFETLIRQNSPTVVSLYIEPTEIFPAEKEAFSRAAAISETFKNRQLQAEYLPDTLPTNQLVEPQLELAGKIYTQLSRRLTEPFIVVTQVASPDPLAATTVARSFAAAFSDDRGPDTDSSHNIPSTADVIPASEGNELDTAWTGFTNLRYRPWGTSLAESSPGMMRVRYLSNSRGTAKAWRFPISVRGGVPGISVRQPAPNFEPGPRPIEPPAGSIKLGIQHRGGVAAVPIQELTRHALITGFTGSGKSNTILFILNQLWIDHAIPFLVIESSKKEYRCLSKVPGFQDLLIFTLGDDSTAPFRFNPFELMPGIRLETHIGRLETCFNAALPQFGILPSIVAEAIDEIYAAEGWMFSDRAEEFESRLFPTMKDLYSAIIRCVEKRGYSGETRDNIRAAAAGRIGSLLRGSKGRMYGTQRSIPSNVLFNRPVILELNDLNEDDKALTMMFLMMQLREYRELHPQNSLQHVTVIEEAHNVIANVRSVSNTEIAADTKAKAVEAFTQMLAEVRAYGEGLIISDQSPEKLARDAIRNTNLQLSHQLRDSDDRQAIARAMIMDQEQKDYLGKLPIGEAALFLTGFEKATFITVPEFKDSAGFLEPPSDEEVRNYMLPFQENNLISYLAFDGCRYCGKKCEYRHVIEPSTLKPTLHDRFKNAILRFNTRREQKYWRENWQVIAEACMHAVKDVIDPVDVEAAYCYFVQEIDFPFTEHMRTEYIAATEKIRGG